MDSNCWIYQYDERISDRFDADSEGIDCLCPNYQTTVEHIHPSEICKRDYHTVALINVVGMRAT